MDKRELGRSGLEVSAIGPGGSRRQPWPRCWRPLPNRGKRSRPPRPRRHAAPATVTNSIGMRFVRIPAGSFMMGAVDHDRQAGPHEKPRHRVTISRPFYFARFEVTQAQWEAVMGSSP